MSEQSFEDRARAIMSRLQTELQDNLVSWKPGTVIKTKGGDYLGIFFPYIDANLLAERLDSVLGAWNWSDRYYVLPGEAGVTVCELTVSLPDECVIKREGVGNFENTDEGHAEHGSRTRAFRDACRSLGVCGRDLNGAQTSFIPVTCNEWDDKGKIKYRNVKPVAPLSRDLLVYPGRLHSGAPSPALGRVLTSPDSNSTVRSPEQAHELTEKDIKPSDVDNIVWEAGKHKGKVLTEVPSAYLEWALENMDQLKPDSPKFKQKLYDAVLIALDVKAKRKAEKNEAGATPAQAAEFFDGSEV